MEKFYYQVGRLPTEEEVQRKQERLHRQESDERKYLFENVFTFSDIQQFVDRYDKSLRIKDVQDHIDYFNEMSEDLGLEYVGSFIWECYQRYPELKS